MCLCVCVPEKVLYIENIQSTFEKVLEINAPAKALKSTLFSQVLYLVTSTLFSYKYGI